ncbi:MAG: hypothetical protein H7Y43_04520, partial [Akkermansiaceae bacterium]|nr:hypothetical protein [Verrucomicrobiales bacterium]
MALTCALLISTAFTCFAQLKVDFDVVDGTGTLVANSVTEPGFESFGVQNQTTNPPYHLFRTVTFNTVAWGNINVTLNSDANPLGTDYIQAPRAIARTVAQVATYNGTLASLARDFVGIDTRSTNAGATTLNVQLSGLPAGQFELVSFHQDAENSTGPFNVWVNGSLVATNGDIRSSTSGENPGVGNPPNFMVTPFTSDGSTPTTISFQMTLTNSPDVVNRILVLNGFVLANRGQGLVAYSFNAAPTSVFFGQTAQLSWVGQTNATFSIDLIGDVTANTTNGAGSLTVTPSDFAGAGTTATFTLSVQNTNTFETGTRTVPIRVLPDVVSFRATPNVVHFGNPVTLSWTVHPSATVSILGIGSMNAQTTNGVGSVVVNPAGNTNYTLQIDRGGNLSDSNVVVVVIPAGGTGTLTNELVSYWPLDVVLGTKTPDLVSGYDFTIGANEGGKPLPTLVSSGYRSNAFQFTANNTILQRVHAPSDQLPAIKHDSFTVSFWVMSAGQDDRRAFAEASTANNNPLFTIASATVAGGTAPVRTLVRYLNGGVEVNSQLTTARPID